MQKKKTYFGKIEFLIQKYSMNYAEKQNVFKKLTELWY